MRPSRPRSSGDVDVVDVLLVEDEYEDAAPDHLQMVLHELALEAMAWRARWPGEDRPPADPDAADEDHAPAGLVRRLARRYRRRAVTAAALAVAVALTTAVVDARQTASRAAALAALPAVLTEGADPSAEVWRLRGRVVTDQDDRLLVADGVSLRRIDPATGEVTWTASPEAGRAASTGGCFPVDEDLRPDRAPVEDGGGPRDLLACVDDLVGGAPAGAAVTTGARVVVLDSTTGRTRQTVTADGALLLVEPVARDLLVAVALPDGRVRVTRWDLAAGTPRWDSISPGPVVAGGVADAVERRPDSLTIGTFAVDVATGETLDAERESAQPYPYEEHALPGGARVTWGWYQDGTSGRGSVSDATAGRSHSLPGPPLWPSVSDGSHARTLVVHTPRGDRLRGVDLRTGRTRWTVPYPGASALRATALVEGVMLLDDGPTAAALDVGTGDVVWRTGVDDVATDGPALTDGEVVLLPVRAGDGALELVAHRIADGTVVRRTAVPAQIVSMTVVDHHLVASTEDAVMGLG